MAIHKSRNSQTFDLKENGWQDVPLKLPPALAGWMMSLISSLALAEIMCE